MKKFYISLPENKTELVEFLFWVMVAYALFTWFSLHVHTSITADTLWLCEAAERFLAGQKMSEAYYDPNPPLSVLLYIPPVLASMTGLITVYHAVFGYTLLLVAAFSFLTHRILSNMPGIDSITAVTAAVALTISNTIFSSLSFTERDQILGMALVPFVLTQIAITKRWPLPPVLKHLALLCGAALILLKPHHGLFPTLMLLHRVIIQKRLNVWKDADFLYLSSAVLAYAALLFLLFSDYLHIVFPDVMNLYLREPQARVLMKTLFYATIGTIGLLAFFILGQKSWLPPFLLIASLVSLVPYIVQMRGYHYHLMPAATFFWCAISIIGKDFFQKFMAHPYALILITFIMTSTAFALTPMRLTFPTHEQYKNLPLAKFLETCEDPCPIFILNDHIEIIHQTSQYSGKPWASRFPSFWFLPGIFNSEKTSPSDFEAYRKKYGLMVAEDLARYKPELVLIGEFKVREQELFNFVDFFTPVESFKKEWDHYKKIDDFHMNQGVYFTGTAWGKPRPHTYQVYRREKD